VRNAARAKIETKVLLATSISQTIWSIGAGCSTLPCTANDLERVLQIFDKEIPNIKDACKHRKRGEYWSPDDRVGPKVASTFPEELVGLHEIATLKWHGLEYGRIHLSIQ